MKKIAVAFTVLFLSASATKAQDVKKVRIAYTINKLEDAKVELDKLSADPKFNSNAEAVLLKTMIYGRIGGDSALGKKYPGAIEQAYESLKRYLELDPSGKKIKDEGGAGLIDIYRSYFSKGVKEYNSKNWDSAFGNFQKVVDVFDVLVAQKLTDITFDTTTFLFAGVTAQNANKEDQALKYYTKLAEARAKGPDYQHIYVFLPSYYAGKKDTEQFRKYIALGKEVYPEKTVWNDLDFEYSTTNSSIDELVKKYDEDDANKKLTAADYFDYGNLFVNDKRVKDLTPPEKSKFLQKSFSAFTKAAEMDSTNVLATYNAAIMQFSMFEEAADAAREIKGTTADIKAKRGVADKFADAQADKSIVLLEESYNKLSRKAEKSKVENNSQKTAARFLTNVLLYKRERSKGNDALYDKYDKKFAFYDTKWKN